MSSPVTTQSLLHGAVYALAQCGLLLGDAKLLYENGSYATATAVALFAREELGRWKILLERRKRVLAGESLAVEDIQKACDDHVDKQEAGMTSLTMRGVTGSGVGKLLDSRSKAPLGSKEREEADKQVDDIHRRTSKRTPDDRHRLRMKALYVDILSEDQWNQPAREISQTTAWERLVEATNDYELQRDQWYTALPLVKARDPELHDALVQWSDRPELRQVEAPWPPQDPSLKGPRARDNGRAQD